MFALPLTASLPSTLASHVFGRFSASFTPRMAVQSPAAASGALRADAATDFEEEEEFDLAQRVREVGEW